MSIRELYDWYEYYNNEPFLSDRIEVQLATISLMISAFGGNKKAKYTDFMICKQPKKELSQAEKDKQIIAAFKSI